MALDPQEYHDRRKVAQLAYLANAVTGGAKMSLDASLLTNKLKVEEACALICPSPRVAGQYPVNLPEADRAMWEEVCSPQQNGACTAGAIKDLGLQLKFFDNVNTMRCNNGSCKINNLDQLRSIARWAKDQP